MSELSSPSGTPEVPSPLKTVQASIDQTLSQSKQTVCDTFTRANASTITVQTLINRRAVLTSSLLSSPAIKALQLRHSSFPTLSKVLKSHRTRSITKDHRLCTSATLFESHDPSPHAPDAGRVIGIRIEVLSSRNGARKYLTPIYVLLHKPILGKDELRVLRHTVPPAIPLQDLVARFLPSSKPSSEGIVSKTPEQDVPSLVRALRQEVVNLQRRKDAARNLENARGVRAVKVLDGEERDWKISWQVGGYARVKITKSGEIEDVVVMTVHNRRDRRKEKKLRDALRVERLEAAIHG